MTTLCHHCQRPLERTGPYWFHVEHPAWPHPAEPAEPNTDYMQLAALGAHLERRRQGLDDAAEEG